MINKSILSIIFTLILFCNFINYGNGQDFKMITLNTGPVSDLGFNNMINRGRIAVTKAMNIEDSRIYIVDGYNDTMALLLPLIQVGDVSLVICSSQGHTQACTDIAKMYVADLSMKTQFLVRGSGNVTRNLIQITYNYASVNYVSGIFAGLKTKTNKIGFLSPGIAANNNDSFVAAFYLGVKKANPQAEFIYWNIGSFLNEDKSIAATKDLLNRGCDVIGDTLDDFSMGNEVIRQGGLAIGTNGFPQRDVYGENVEFQYSYNWTKYFLPIAQHVQNGVANEKWYADFNSADDLNFYDLQFGFEVSQDIITKVNDNVKILMTTTRAKHPYYCNDYFLNYTLPIAAGTPNCISTANFFRIQAPLPGMTYLGNYTIKLVEVKFDNSVRLGFSIISGVIIAIVLAMIGGIVYYNNQPSIRSASPIFLNLILVGGIIVYIGVILWVSPISTGTCNARFWLVSLGFSTLIGSLVVKNVRIWLIFDNPELKAIKITNYQLFPYVGICLLINIILMSIITSVGDLKAIDAFDIDSLGKYEFMPVCKMNSQGAATLYTLLGYFAALLLVGVFVSWKIRIVDIEEFNESSVIAKTLYAVSFCIFVIIPLLIAPQDKQSETIIICVAALFLSVAALTIVFVPKFYRVFKYGSDGTNEMFKQKKSSSVATARAESSKSSSGGATRVNRRGNIVSNDFSDDTESDLTEPKQNNNNVPESVTKGAILAEFTDDSHSEFGDEEELPIGDEDKQTE